MAAERLLDTAGGAEKYYYSDGQIVHELQLGALRVCSAVEAMPSEDDPKGGWWSRYLAGAVPKARQPIAGSIRVVDLFCGPGGLANGVRQLCTELGKSFVSEFIADQDEGATMVYAANHETRARSSESVRQLIDYSIKHAAQGAKFAYMPEIVDSALAVSLSHVDVVLAGPPCQGHSNLNNLTRRSDPRNSLYLTVPAFAVAVGAPICIIENVPAVLNDSEGVVEIAEQLLKSEGYEVTSGVISAASLGWPQTRKRHFLVARRDRAPIPIDIVTAALKDTPRSLWWAIHDLEDCTGGDLLDQPSELNMENKARIAWLFENDKYELDLQERPKSHRDGTTYTAVYGRLRKGKPAPTITTGFMTPGRGRFTHPTRMRTLTPHEAARLQGFPDSYRFVTDPSLPPSRRQLAKWIGDAVPMPLGYAAALSAFAPGLPLGRTSK